MDILAVTRTEGKDFIGNPIIIGDLVAYTSGEAALGMGVVTGFTPKGVRLFPFKIKGIYMMSTGTSVSRDKATGKYTYTTRDYINRKEDLIVRMSSDYADLIGLPPSFIAEILGGS